MNTKSGVRVETLKKIINSFVDGEKFVIKGSYPYDKGAFLYRIVGNGKIRKLEFIHYSPSNRQMKQELEKVKRYSNRLNDFNKCLRRALFPSILEGYNEMRIRETGQHARRVYFRLKSCEETARFLTGRSPLRHQVLDKLKEFAKLHGVDING